ncbi:MAG: RdgB/HAM1 family non-canonical purine NTP pyrophosphatase [Acidobacteriota bacterium]|nr:RdgB/HAM1 family non-canonical purine NTP pyrophosphatase [Acidobacteriota bacterium]
MVLYACSTNQGKLSEFALAARQSPIPGPEILPLPNIKQITPPEETGATFEENAAIKAVYYSGFTDELVFADDSGLEVDALGNEPGVFSARYAGAAATDAANNELVLNRLEHQLNRHGRFVCAIALAKAGKLMTVVQGTVEGEVLESAQGANGFGYDPLFFYPPLGCAFAELAAEDKFAVSHRGNALRALFDWLGRNAD